MAGIVSGCYKDKGKYDYTSLNWIEIDYSPSDYVKISNSSVTFQYRQPLTEVQNKSVIPVVKQDLSIDESQLSYYWITTSGRKDTLEQKEFHYELLPKQATTISRLLKITDHSTGVDYYRMVDIKTVPPYKDNWFVLHGDEGDRRLGAAENMEGKPLVTTDCYELQYGRRRFQQAFGLGYAHLGEDLLSGEFEVLQIFEPDSCFSMYPFLMRIKKINQEMLLDGVFEGIEFQKVVYSESGNGYLGVLTNRGLLVAAWGNYSPVGTEGGISDYRIDDIYISAGGYATIWDGLEHRFLSYKFQSGKVNKLALVNPKIFEEVDLSDKTCRAFLASTASPNGVMAIMQDQQNSYWYEINYAWNEDKLPGAVEAGGTTFRQGILKNMSFDERSCFAANGIFDGQFFYSVGAKIYRYNTINHENLLLYDAHEGIIDKLFFKSYYPEFSNKRPEFPRVLGVVVNTPDGKGKVHEVSLTIAGEVEKSIVYDGFGHIVDLISAKGL